MLSTSEPHPATQQAQIAHLSQKIIKLNTYPTPSTNRSSYSPVQYRLGLDKSSKDLSCRCSRDLSFGLYVQKIGPHDPHRPVFHSRLDVFICRLASYCDWPCFACSCRHFVYFSSLGSNAFDFDLWNQRRSGKYRVTIPLFRAQ